MSLAAWAAGAAAAAPSPLVVTGQVNHAVVLDTAGLAALGLPPITETVTYQTATGPKTATYTGVSTWSLLNSPAIGLKPDPSVAKNDVLGKVVVATGSDGYRAVYSGGELSPSFGGSGQPDLVAVDGGGFRTVTPGDVKGGRYVANLARLDVLNTPTPASLGGGPADHFTVGGGLARTGSFDRAAVAALGLPVITETVTYQSGSTPVTATFSGVSLWSFIDALGIRSDPAVKSDLLSKFLLVSGSDGYKSVFSLGELSPDFGGSASAPDLIAFTENGSPLGADGAFRIVVPGDVKGGRYVSNVVGIDLLGIAAVPEPGTAALCAAGLVLGAARVRLRMRRPARIV